MYTYIVRRLLQTIPIIFGVALLVFVLFNFVGTDPVRMTLGQHASPEAIEDLRRQWGLDQPLWRQFADFLWQIVTLDFGESYNTGEKLSEIFQKGAMVSLMVTLPPYLFGTIINVSLALLISYYRGSWLDKISTFLFVAAMSISYLVYIIGMQYVLAYQFDWFPINGFADFPEGIQYLLLPWIITMAVTMGPDVRLYRTVILNETTQQYVRTARSKGAGEMRVLFKHVLKNAMIPIITYTVIGVPFLVLGAFLLERFFSIPGVGDLIIAGVNTGDFPIVKGLTVLIAIGFTMFNLISDIMYALVDPRVELR